MQGARVSMGKNGSKKSGIYFNEYNNIYICIYFTSPDSNQLVLFEFFHNISIFFSLGRKVCPYSLQRLLPGRK